jgi:hypothetical protein
MELKSVQMFISACHGHEESLLKLKKMLEGGDLEVDEEMAEEVEQKQTPKKTWTTDSVVTWLKTLGGLGSEIKMGYSHFSNTNNNDDEISSNASSQASSIASSALSAATSVAPAVDSPRDAPAEMQRSNKGRIQLKILIQRLNGKLTKAKTKNEQPLTTDTVHWLIRLCHGDIRWNGWHHLAGFVRKARIGERERNGTPALWFRGVAEICSMACGKTREWFRLVKTEDETKWEEIEDYFVISNPDHFGQNAYDIYPGIAQQQGDDQEYQVLKWPIISNIKKNDDQDLSGMDSNDDIGDDDFDSGSLLDDLGFLSAQQRAIGPMFVTMLAKGDAGA